MLRTCAGISTEGARFRNSLAVLNKSHVFNESPTVGKPTWNRNAPATFGGDAISAAMVYAA